MDKQTAISILEDIQEALNKDDWQKETLKTIDIYERNLKVSTSAKIKKLIEQQKEYSKKYGENGRKTAQISKKIDEEIRKIFTK